MVIIRSVNRSKKDTSWDNANEFQGSRKSQIVRNLATTKRNTCQANMTDMMTTFMKMLS